MLRFGAQIRYQSPYKGFNSWTVSQIMPVLLLYQSPYKGFNSCNNGHRNSTGWFVYQSPYKGFNSGGREYNLLSGPYEGINPPIRGSIDEIAETIKNAQTWYQSPYKRFNRKQSKRTQIAIMVSIPL